MFSQSLTWDFYDDTYYKTDRLEAFHGILENFEEVMKIETEAEKKDKLPMKPEIELLYTSDLNIFAVLGKAT